MTCRYLQLKPFDRPDDLPLHQYACALDENPSGATKRRPHASEKMLCTDRSKFPERNALVIDLLPTYPPVPLPKQLLILSEDLGHK